MTAPAISYRPGAYVDLWSSRGNRWHRLRETANVTLCGRRMVTPVLAGQTTRLTRACDVCERVAT